MDLRRQYRSKLNIYQWVIFGIIPVLLFLVSTWFISAKGPYYLGPNLDPEYAYLLNSLDMVQFVPPGHTDHPGTTLQVLGALVIMFKYAISSLIQNTGTVRYEVLTNPESYLRAVNLALNGLIMLFVFLTGLRVYQLKRNRLLAISIQLTPFLFPTLIKATTRVSPEPMLIVVVLWLSLILLSVITNNYQISTKKSVLLGVILGFGAATKVTILPLGLLTLFPEGWRKKLAALAGLVLSFFAFTIPSWPRLIRLGKWLISIALRDGHYGHGQLGLPNWSVLWDSFITLVVADPGFFVLVMIALMLMIYAFLNRREITKSVVNRRIVKFIFIVLLIFVVQTVITVKHPPIHYMVPAMTLAGIFLFAFFSFPKDFWHSDSYGRITVWLMHGFLLVGLIVSFSLSVKEAKAAQDYYAGVVEVQDLIASAYQDCVVINYYRSSSIQYALSFGDIFAMTDFGEELKSLYPDRIFYGIENQAFYGYGANNAMPRNDIRSRIDGGDCFLMQGTPFSSEKYRQFATSLSLERLDYNSEGEALYKLLGFSN